MGLSTALHAARAGLLGSGAGCRRDRAGRFGPQWRPGSFPASTYDPEWLLGHFGQGARRGLVRSSPLRQPTPCSM
ncbi:hypothetical protein ACVOMV_28095 [Mesorhizobium atlanticum]